MTDPRSSEPPTKRSRQELRAELVAVSSGPKSAIARVLQTLHKKGMLVDDELGKHDELRQLSAASHVHADARTPYGLVCQSIPLDMNDG